jgi:hypothetical protein
LTSFLHVLLSASFSSFLPFSKAGVTLSTTSPNKIKHNPVLSPFLPTFLPSSIFLPSFLPSFLPLPSSSFLPSFLNLFPPSLYSSSSLPFLSHFFSYTSPYVSMYLSI